MTRPKHKLSDYVGEHVGGRAHLLKGAATLDSHVELAVARAWPQLARQTRVVMYLFLVKGLRRQEIADVLRVSKRTIDEHTWQAHKRSGARSMTQAYAFYAVRFYQEHTDTKPLNLRYYNKLPSPKQKPLNIYLGAER